MKIKIDDVLLFLRFILKILPFVMELLGEFSDEERETAVTQIKAYLSR